MKTFLGSFYLLFFARARKKSILIVYNIIQLGGWEGRQYSGKKWTEEEEVTADVSEYDMVKVKVSCTTAVAPPLWAQLECVGKKFAYIQLWKKCIIKWMRTNVHNTAKTPIRIRWIYQDIHENYSITNNISFPPSSFAFFVKCFVVGYNVFLSRCALWVELTY